MPARRDQTSRTSPGSSSFGFIALARGINVGGKNRVAMKDLAHAFEASGATSIKTYIQSGNVLFDSKDASRCIAGVTRQLRESLQLEIPLVWRSAADYLRAVNDNPFLAQGADPAFLSLGLLSSAPAPSAVRELDPNRSPGDQFKVIGDTMYLYQPNGIARSKLTNAWIDRALGVTSTFRNWKTATALAALLDPASDS
ncbi:MAG: DUF1697 domain-containing protein [Planctomycetota bacterium]|nr:DUF1697 domain-containing protein [Planctomycetota bacterium]